MLSLFICVPHELADDPQWFVSKEARMCEDPGGFPNPPSHSPTTAELEDIFRNEEDDLQSGANPTSQGSDNRVDVTTD